MRGGTLGLAMLVSASSLAAGLSEIGANDFRISFQEGTGDPSFSASQAAVAYNSTDHEYLVVWQGEFFTQFCPAKGGLSTELEVFRQRIDAASGALQGSPAKISQSGPICDNTHQASTPAVAYNATNNEYLVVWSGNSLAGLLAENEFEIFGQRLNSAGSSVGIDDFRISNMGGNGDSSFGGFVPEVTWNAQDNEYLVVWAGDDNFGALVDDEFEIFGQRLNENGTAQGLNDFLISDMGGTGDSPFDAFSPDVTWNAQDNEYLVVWSGDDNVGGLVDDEFEIFGQRLNAVGFRVGVNDFRISDVGGTGNPSFRAVDPAVTWNGVDNEYLVVWNGDDTSGSLLDDEFEIFGQRLNAAGGDIGSNDFRISEMGGTGNVFRFFPDVTWNAQDNEYLVVWSGDDNEVAGELETFGQRLDATGSDIGSNDFQISDMVGAFASAFLGSFPGVTWNATNNQYLVVWEGADNEGGLVDGELEIFGQRLGGPIIFADGFE